MEAGYGAMHRVRRGEDVGPGAENSAGDAARDSETTDVE